jgi:hypothetical protein
MLDSKDYQHGSLAPGRGHGAGAPLFALLLALAAPALVVALALGWRPPLGSLTQAPTWLGGHAERQAVVPPGPLAEQALPDGRFYTYAPPRTSPTERGGYAVTNADDIPFWTEYQRLGGPPYLGYPRSRRFASDEAVLQVFQRGVLRFEDPESGVTVVRLLDQLHAQGDDPELSRRWGIAPLELPVPPDAAPGLAADRLVWLLHAHPAFRDYLDAAPDAAAWLGWPTSPVRDAGGFYVLRFQGGALQQWKHEMPWAKAGSVTAANVGDIAVAFSTFPADALLPEPAPPAGAGS